MGNEGILRGVTESTIIEPSFFNNAAGQTTNANAARNLVSKLRDADVEENKCFQQDGATCRPVLETMQLSYNLFLDRAISRFVDQNLPPTSP